MKKKWIRVIFSYKFDYAYTMKKKNSIKRKKNKYVYSILENGFGDGVVGQTRNELKKLVRQSRVSKSEKNDSKLGIGVE